MKQVLLVLLLFISLLGKSQDTTEATSGVEIVKALIIWVDTAQINKAYYRDDDGPMFYELQIHVTPGFIERSWLIGSQIVADSRNGYKKNRVRKYFPPSTYLSFDGRYFDKRCFIIDYKIIE